MPTPFVGEVKIVSFNFAPQGWALCNGALLPINQNQALFSLLGTRYGGNGQTNFALPDLRGRVPMHFDNGFNQGTAGGEEAHTLTISEMPTHVHQAMGTSAAATTAVPTGNLFGNATAAFYADANPLQPLRPNTITSTGGSQPHENRAPYTVLNFVIALTGFFPSRD